jgi:hypothetical protein
MLSFRATVAGVSLVAAVLVGGCGSDSGGSAAGAGAGGSTASGGASAGSGGSDAAGSGGTAGSAGSGTGGVGGSAGGTGGAGGATGGSAGSGTAGATGAPTFAEIRMKIFLPSCGTGNCHLNGKTEGNLDLSDAVAYGQLVNVDSLAAPTKKRVVPGSSADSFLFAKVNGNVAADGSEGAAMPLIVGMLQDDKLAMIKAWIDAGAKND